MPSCLYHIIITSLHGAVGLVLPFFRSHVNNHLGWAILGPSLIADSPTDKDFYCQCSLVLSVNLFWYIDC